MRHTVVFFSKFFDIKLIILIYVQGTEGTLHKISSELTHLTNNNPKELIEVYLTWLVDIHWFEKALDILWINI